MPGHQIYSKRISQALSMLIVVASRTGVSKKNWLVDNIKRNSSLLGKSSLRCSSGMWSLGDASL